MSKNHGIWLSERVNVKININKYSDINCKKIMKLGKHINTLFTELNCQLLQITADYVRPKT